MRSFLRIVRNNREFGGQGEEGGYVAKIVLQGRVARAKLVSWCLHSRKRTPTFRFTMRAIQGLKC